MSSTPQSTNSDTKESIDFLNLPQNSSPVPYESDNPIQSDQYHELGKTPQSQCTDFEEIQRLIGTPLVTSNSTSQFKAAAKLQQPVKVSLTSIIAKIPFGSLTVASLLARLSSAELKFLLSSQGLLPLKSESMLASQLAHTLLAHINEGKFAHVFHQPASLAAKSDNNIVSSQLTKRPAMSGDATPVKRVTTISTQPAAVISLEELHPDSQWNLIEEDCMKALNSAVGQAVAPSVDGQRGIKLMLTKYVTSDWRACDQATQSLINESDTRWVTAQLLKKVMGKTV